MVNVSFHQQHDKYFNLNYLINITKLNIIYWDVLNIDGPKVLHHLFNSICLRIQGFPPKFSSLLVVFHEFPSRKKII